MRTLQRPRGPTNSDAAARRGRAPSRRSYIQLWRRMHCEGLYQTAAAPGEQDSASPSKSVLYRALIIKRVPFADIAFMGDDTCLTVFLGVDHVSNRVGPDHPTMLAK